MDTQTQMLLVRGMTHHLHIAACLSWLIGHNRLFLMYTMAPGTQYPSRIISMGLPHATSATASRLIDTGMISMGPLYQRGARS